MRKLILLIVILMIASCKNADYEVESVATENTTVENFDKTVFYEDYIQEKFNEIVEQKKIQLKNPNFPNRLLPGTPINLDPNLKFKSLKLTSTSEDYGYPYSYLSVQTYWDSFTKKEMKFNDIISIHEGFQVIQDDSIPVVKIIWKHRSS